MTAIRQTTRVKPDRTVEVRTPALPPGQEVEVVVLPRAAKSTTEDDPYGFLRVLEEAKLEGPPDWSANVEAYLHDGKHF